MISPRGIFPGIRGLAMRRRQVGLLALLAALTAWQVHGQDPMSGGNEPVGSRADLPILPDAAANALATPESAAAAPRLREGTQLTDRMGYFRQNGDSLTFVDEEGRELGGLPNLSLERIIRMLKSVEEPEGVKWSVSGTVTEFAGRNYLLIGRAIYKAAVLPPQPDALQ